MDKHAEGANKGGLLPVKIAELTDAIRDAARALSFRDLMSMEGPPPGRADGDHMLLRPMTPQGPTNTDPSMYR